MLVLKVQGGFLFSILKLFKNKFSFSFKILEVVVSSLLSLLCEIHLHRRQFIFLQEAPTASIAVASSLLTLLPFPDTLPHNTCWVF